MSWKGVWVWTWGHWGEERKGGASRKRAQPGGGRSRQAAFRGRTGGMRRRRVPRRPNPGVRWSPLWWLTALRVAEASRWAHRALLDTVDYTVERLACSSRGESAPLATTPWPPSGAHTTRAVFQTKGQVLLAALSAQRATSNQTPTKPTAPPAHLANSQTMGVNRTARGALPINTSAQAR